jgi:predicted Zn-dependent protease
MVSFMRKKLTILMLALPFCSFVGCSTNPITGQQELMLFSPQQDIEIGRKYAPELEKQLGGRVASRTLQNYVDSIGKRVAAVSHNPNFEYNFVALNHESINAFALPGGYIFITRGMLEKLETEAQMAAILAHEIAHVVARDTMNVMSNQIGIDTLLSAVTSENTPAGVTTAANLTSQIIGLSYSREDEKTADLAGLDYMTWAGYNPYGMVETIQMLQSLHQSRGIEFFSTHPSPENRLGYITQKIQTQYPNAATLRVGKQDYLTYVLKNL